ncbi:MAG: hypothetical protein LKG11_00850 [Bacilli bacterium]|jgi:hypothetical protein|nr:hypothetical protein [Bacilli bacterium]
MNYIGPNTVCEGFFTGVVVSVPKYLDSGSRQSLIVRLRGINPLGTEVYEDFMFSRDLARAYKALISKGDRLYVQWFDHSVLRLCKDGTRKIRNVHLVKSATIVERNVRFDVSEFDDARMLDALDPRNVLDIPLRQERKGDGK